MIREGELLRSLLVNGAGAHIFPGPEQSIRVLPVEDHGKIPLRQLPLPIPLPQAFHRQKTAFLDRGGREVLQIRLRGLLALLVPLRLPLLFPLRFLFRFLHQACDDIPLGRRPPVPRDFAPGKAEILPRGRDVPRLRRGKGQFVRKVRGQGGLREGGGKPFEGLCCLFRFSFSGQGQPREIQNVIPEVEFVRRNFAERLPRLGKLRLGEKGPPFTKRVVLGRGGCGMGERREGKQEMKRYEPFQLPQ